MSKEISIIIPYRESRQKDRKIIADWCIGRYKSFADELFKKYEIILCDSKDEIFSRGKSINKGILESKYDYIIILDSDYLFDMKLFSQMVNNKKWTIAVTHKNYYFINEEKTNNILSKKNNLTVKDYNIDKYTTQSNYFLYGGILSMPKKNFIGFDPNIYGYGYEDNIFYHSMKLYHGKEFRTNLSFFHMFHKRPIYDIYMKESYKNKAYYDKVWIPILNNRKKMREYIESWCKFDS